MVALLVGLFLYCLGLELGTRYGFSRASRIQGRITADLRVARSLKADSRGGVPSVLLVGNSLLLEGVDRAMLRRKMSAHYVVAILPIENTQFDDWYFGVRRMFSEGSRPSVLVVCLSTRHLMSHSTCGEYFAHFLMQRRDLLAVKQESRLNNTMTSEYLFASYSAWLGSRGQIRNWLLHKVMPKLEVLVRYFPGPTPPMPAATEVVAGVVPHLTMLDEVCRGHGVRLVIVVPPPTSQTDGSAEVQASAARLGIPVLVPMRPGELSPSEFTDGFHLNVKGRARFSERLAAALSETLEGR
jgi:hypothetical protein